MHQEKQNECTGVLMGSHNFKVSLYYLQASFKGENLRSYMVTKSFTYHCNVVKMQKCTLFFIDYKFQMLVRFQICH